MMTEQEPLISKSDIKAIHQANQFNKRVLQDGLRELVESTHKGNTQTGELIKEVTTKWTN